MERVLKERANKITEEEFKKNLNELENVETQEEMEKKLDNLMKGGFFLTNWMKSLFNKSSNEEFKAVWLSIDEYKQQAEESLQTAWRILNLPTWRLEKRGSHRGDVVESVNVDQLGKVYRFTGIVDCPAKFLYEEFKNNMAKLPDWNPTILKNEFIKEVGPGVDLSYQVTAGGGRGIISPRDFVILRRTAQMSREGLVTDAEPYCYMTSGVSVQVPGYPPQKDLVRGHNKVGCWVMKPKSSQTAGGKIEECTIFHWLMCCDLKGKIPQFVLDAAFATVMLDYIVHVRKFAADSKAKGLF
ncbi:PREDICTED: steroidogenic acute regulatory protein, mitochondrial-like [Papilio polytes]|uniref:steroidogenic acute regulatory protein, mitochondrial-like n=1 Tax=Papilio polytes TaxID=76194 RepID=UPI00067674EF|nr:PREDICTED: steroidogenic acute regulatory protein, mitochondrial-like [Papilio polytes]